MCWWLAYGRQRRQSALLAGSACALTSNGGVGAGCAGSWPSVARSSPRSRVTTVWGEFPSQVLRATYRVRPRMTSFHIRNPGNSCRSAANSSFTGVGSLLAQPRVHGRAVSQRTGIGVAAPRSWSWSSHASMVVEEAAALLSVGCQEFLYFERPGVWCGARIGAIR
jgi:hypothetical protein